MYFIDPKIGIKTVQKINYTINCAINNQRRCVTDSQIVQKQGQARFLWDHKDTVTFVVMSLFLFSQPLETSLDDSFRLDLQLTCPCLTQHKDVGSRKRFNSSRRNFLISARKLLRAPLQDLKSSLLKLVLVDFGLQEATSHRLTPRPDKPKHKLSTLSSPPTHPPLPEKALTSPSLSLGAAKPNPPPL